MPAKRIKRPQAPAATPKAKPAPKAKAASKAKAKAPVKKKKEE